MTDLPPLVNLITGQLTYSVETFVGGEELLSRYLNILGITLKIPITSAFCIEYTCLINGFVYNQLLALNLDPMKCTIQSNLDCKNFIVSHDQIQYAVFEIYHGYVQMRK